MKLPEKIRIFKARNNLKYKFISKYVGTTEQAVKNWCNDKRCPKKIKLLFAERLVELSKGYITLKDTGN